MISISNLFSDNDISKKDDMKKIDPSPSLNQGKKFKKYQKKIENSLEKSAEILSGKEGFSDMNNTSLTEKTNNIINNNPLSDTNQQTLDNLRQEYQNTLKEYEDLFQKISGNISGYVDRVSSNNPYLNKTIRFTTGHICYVTNQGIVKYIPNPEIRDSISVPKKSIDVNIPWDNSYSTPGTVIPTTPPLVSGTNVQKGQSFGNEGSTK